GHERCPPRGSAWEGAHMRRANGHATVVTSMSRLFECRRTARPRKIGLASRTHGAANAPVVDVTPRGEENLAAHRARARHRRDGPGGAQRFGGHVANNVTAIRLNASGIDCRPSGRAVPRVTLGRRRSVAMPRGACFTATVTPRVQFAAVNVASAAL